MDASPNTVPGAFTVPIWMPFLSTWYVAGTPVEALQVMTGPSRVGLVAWTFAGTDGGPESMVTDTLLDEALSFPAASTARTV
jgi:hypothetical protein